MQGFHTTSYLLAVLGFSVGVVGMAEQVRAEDTAETQKILYDFSSDSSLDDWEVEDDVVMGGRSDGHLTLSEEGYGVFHGRVSLENNGGFSSVQRYFEPIDVSGYSTAVLRVKGDGKRYQFRVMSHADDRPSYIHHFETSGEWETVEIPLADMVPMHHGNQLDQPNYPGEKLAHIRFLIGNGKAETFRLEIDWIALR